MDTGQPMESQNTEFARPRTSRGRRYSTQGDSTRSGRQTPTQSGRQTPLQSGRQTPLHGRRTSTETPMTSPVPMTDRPRTSRGRRATVSGWAMNIQFMITYRSNSYYIEIWSQSLKFQISLMHRSLAYLL